MIVIGVSNRKIHTKKRGKPINKGGQRAKKYYFLYYYDQDGVFRSKRCSKIEAFFRKFQKKKTTKYVCSTCNRSFKAYNQKKKDIRCPYCDE